jgi:hydrogenase nickel incorporation protein HypA/HybF
MHELSIATAVIDEVTKHVAGAGGGRVIAVTLRIGRLATVEEGSLRFGFAIASAGTDLAGARLEIIDVPVRIWCPQCLAERALPSLQRFACPECGQPSGDIRAGRELDLESIEWEPFAPQSPHPESPRPELHTPRAFS